MLFLLAPYLASASPRDTVQLVAQAPAPVNGRIALALEFKLSPGWHIYWANPGDAGLPPALLPAAPAIFGPLQYPAPELLSQGPVTDYVLSGDVFLPFEASGVGNSVHATAQWLVCSDICVPEHAALTLTFPATPVAVPDNGVVPSPFAATLSPDGTLHIAGLAAAQVSSARFFPLTPGVMANGAAQRIGFDASGMTLKLDISPGAAPSAGVLELTDSAGGMQALSITPTRAAAAAGPPFWVLAFLGGLILNLMPCVFPILALKALAVLRMGARQMHREALGYTAGVLAAMLMVGGALLALRGLGAAAGWGFQFQHPAFVALMAWLMLAITLNLAGLFEVALPAALGRLHAQGSFATGVLAVLLATPCTAPFMGAAVAAALASPGLAALEIFLALGLGLAAPFLALAFIPGLPLLLPRPGAWMQAVQRLLAVPMFLTFCWLGWVLYRQAGIPGVAILAAGALFMAAALRRARPFAFAVIALAPLLRPAQSAPLTLPGAQPYTAARLAALRASGTPVFVDLTAAWCVTCLVNEATTLKNPGVQRAFKVLHVVTLVGDWTQKNPQITALLSANGRDGVPLYLYFAPGREAAVLPQVLDPEIVEEAIK